jgi:bifunctional non-homologous end joining protein LigD
MDKLKYAAKLKAGFTPRDKQLILASARKLRIKSTPFSELPIGQGGRWGEGLTEEDLEKIVWLQPRLVVQVQFVEWTRHQMLRHPVFKGLRDDKRPEEVVREER